MFTTLGINENFLAIEEKYCAFDTSKVVILTVPYEHTVSYGGGTKQGPSAILKASHQVELYDEETAREIYKMGIATLEPMDFGTKKDEDALENIYKRTKELLALNKYVVTLGGEHTISQALIAAYAEKYHDLSIVQVDAHADLRMEYLGNKFSHACVMARVCEFLAPNRIVQIGIRALSLEEAEWIKEKGITTLYTHEIRGGKYTKILKMWDDYAIEKLTEHVYVTFDVDGLDPSVMPATGTPEPNGLMWHETMSFLKKLGTKRKVVGFDVVEFSPIPHLHYADITAAKLVSKMINYFVH